MNLLADEVGFLGATFAPGSNTIVVTTDSRAVVGEEDFQWILSGTSQRFACPAKQMPGSVNRLLGVKADRLALVLYSALEEEEKVVCAFSQPIFQFFPISASKALVVFGNGHCELRNVLDATQPMLALRPPAFAMVFAELISPHLLILVSASGQVRVVRVSEKLLKQDRLIEFNLEVKQACVHNELNRVAEGDGEFALSLLDTKGKLFTYQVLANEVSPWLQDFSLPDSLHLCAAPGLCMLRFHQDKVEAWDICHGVLLEAWPLATGGSGKCGFIAASQESGKVVFAAGKQLETVQVDAAGVSSLARSLTVAKPALTPVAKKPKLTTEKAVREHLTREDTRYDAGAVRLAFDNQWYDLLSQLFIEKVVRSTRGLDSPFVSALKQHGHIDFCLAAMQNCNDIPATQLVQLVKFCLTLVGEEQQKATKVVREFGQNDSGVDALDFGVAKLISNCFVCPALVEAELVQALAEQFSCAEEMLALVASLRFGAETMVEAREAMQVLLSCAHPLNLVLSKSKLPKFALNVLNELRLRIVREIAMCEKAEKASQKLDLILSGALPLKARQANGKYQVETCLL
ncbi:hypothetical protein BASA81_001436 [Batrachochytrium salamandrivorans]|nr:hypothetical protein BASA81_001436 [Batrachochytrium salamandrivorans]